MHGDVEPRLGLVAVERRADVGDGLVQPSKVEPSTATTPMVFSSHWASAPATVMWYCSPSMGTRRGSTSQ